MWKLIGNLVAAFPAVSLRRFYYLTLENIEIKAMTFNHGNHDAKIALCNNGREEIHWWITSIMSNFQCIHVLDPDIIIHTDSSILRWGITDGKNAPGGRWKADEISYINLLELKTILIRVMTYCKGKTCKHVRIMSEQ